ncbi:hypothetical protein J6590_065343 [Homalodisca vitripennis]|nr:hypothetical protein J6590_065343 [Homalodisca vitripennis]
MNNMMTSSALGGTNPYSEVLVEVELNLIYRSSDMSWENQHVRRNVTELGSWAQSISGLPGLVLVAGIVQVIHKQRFCKHLLPVLVTSGHGNCTLQEFEHSTCSTGQLEDLSEVMIRSVLTLFTEPGNNVWPITVELGFGPKFAPSMCGRRNCSDWSNVLQLKMTEQKAIQRNEVGRKRRKKVLRLRSEYLQHR